jgi:hypothetical protein
MNFASAEKPLPIAIHATDGAEKPYSGQRRLTVMPHREARSHVQPLSPEQTCR